MAQRLGEGEQRFRSGPAARLGVRHSLRDGQIHLDLVSRPSRAAFIDEPACPPRRFVRGPLKLEGMPLTLATYAATSRTNAHFHAFDLAALDRIYIPPGLTGLMNAPPVSQVVFLEDDNRGAVSREPVATLDGLGFHISIKGVGSTTDPYSSRPLDAASASRLTDSPEVRQGLAHPTMSVPAGEPERVITGERWLRGSPYGGQGLEHAEIAMRVSEQADLTSLRGFLIAPVVKIAFFPPELEERLRTIHWYRRFAGPIVQEIRLVPSNVRIYFHAKNTIGSDPRHIFELFGIQSSAEALRFETRFMRSAVALLTLYARTLRFDPVRQRYSGLDFHDVWLDKDAVLAPNGSVYFVDLEGIEEEATDPERLREKLEDQIYRSLYEFLFAYEQLEQERVRRFGAGRARKDQFADLLKEALADDPFVRARESARGVEMEIRNALAAEDLYTTFLLVDR